VCSIEI